MHLFAVEGGRNHNWPLYLSAVVALQWAMMLLPFSRSIHFVRMPVARITVRTERVCLKIYFLLVEANVGSKTNVAESTVITTGK